MAQLRVSELKASMSFLGFLLVRSSELRQGKNGNSYVDMNLADCSGEINCKNWNTGGIAYPVGDIVKVMGTTLDYNGRLQLKIEKIRAAAPNDPVDMSMLIPAAPRSASEMLSEIRSCIDGFSSDILKAITNKLIERYTEKLNYYPAAQRIHHAEQGGLLHHTTGMLACAKAILEVYPFLNRDLLLAGVIIHDLCKTEEMDSDKLGVVRDYTREGLLLGHLVLGVSRIQEAALQLGYDGTEEVLLLQHMMLSHHGEAEFGSPRPPMTLEAEVLHWIDLLDARMNEMQTNLSKVFPGAFTDKIWSLDRRLYRPTFMGKENPRSNPEQ